jgi:hypothetical protein
MYNTRPTRKLRLNLFWYQCSRTARELTVAQVTTGLWTQPRAWNADRITWVKQPIRDMFISYTLENCIDWGIASLRMCTPAAGKETHLISTKYLNHGRESLNSFLCVIAFDFTGSVTKFQLPADRIFLGSPAFTISQMLQLNCRKDCRQTLGCRWHRPEWCSAHSCAEVPTRLLKAPKFANTSPYLLLFVYWIIRFKLAKLTGRNVLKTSIKSLLNSKNCVNPLCGDVYINIWTSKNVLCRALSI